MDLNLIERFRQTGNESEFRIFVGTILNRLGNCKCSYLPATENELILFGEDDDLWSLRLSRDIELHALLGAMQQAYNLAILGSKAKFRQTLRN